METEWRWMQPRGLRQPPVQRGDELVAVRGTPARETVGQQRDTAEAAPDLLPTVVAAFDASVPDFITQMT